MKGIVTKTNLWAKNGLPWKIKFLNKKATERKHYQHLILNSLKYLIKAAFAITVFRPIILSPIVLNYGKNLYETAIL